MQNTLREALKASVTFDFNNVTPTGGTAAAKKVAILPGIYNTMKQVTDSTSKETVVVYTDPANLVNAGYSCDEVADDYNAASGVFVQVTSNKRAKFRDFLNYVQRVGVACSRIVIQNKNTSSQDIYDQDIEIARTVIGAKGGTDFIQLQDYVSVDAYDRSKITIDLSQDPLILTPEVFMAITVPIGGHFSMQFVFDSQVPAV